MSLWVTFSLCRQYALIPAAFSVLFCTSMIESKGEITITTSLLLKMAKSFHSGSSHMIGLDVAPERDRQLMDSEPQSCPTLISTALSSCSPSLLEALVPRVLWRFLIFMILSNRFYERIQSSHNLLNKPFVGIHPLFKPYCKDYATDEDCNHAVHFVT